MSESNTTVTVGWLSGLNFWFFIAVKLVGTSFATWSWWWMLLPYVPNISLIVKHFNL